MSTPHLAEFEPVGGVFFRDARPFQAGEAHAATTVPFPPPPLAFWFTALRALRERPGRADGASTRLIDSRGLGLASDEHGDLFPAPLDLVVEKATEDRPRRRWQAMSPLQSSQVLGPPFEGGFLPPWNTPCFESAPVEGFLSRKGWLSYLSGASDSLDVIPRSELCVIQTRTGTELAGRKAASGLLYSEPVTFLRGDLGVRFRAAMDVEGEPATVSRIVRLGGEAKGARFTMIPGSWDGGFDEELREACYRQILAASGGSASARVKIVLLTPAVFSADVRLLRRYPETPAWRPFWLTTRPSDVPWLGTATLSLRSAVVGRPFSLGMWDREFHNRKRKPGDADGGAPTTSGGAPKPLHRCVPAGSVYHVTLDAGTTEALPVALTTLFDQLWFKTLLIGIDRDGRPRPTGFGRAGLGTVVLGGWDEC